MASGNGRMSAAWARDEALCSVVPPLISPLKATGKLNFARVAAIVRRHAAALAR
jgi:dihydrodipicolinate synthase/N-acetylneuraminate lyase